MNEAYILMGGNIGDRQACLETARTAIDRRIGGIIRASGTYETAAWGMENQPDFLNQVLLIETTFAPLQLLNRLLALEQEMGRYRQQKFGPRNIDLDILCYNQWVVHLPGLRIPHPRMLERRFVLAPLAEIAPQLRHPVNHRTMETLLSACTDPLPVYKSGPAVDNNA